MDKLIGQEDSQVIFAEMDGNTIKRLSSYYIEYPENTYDGNTYLTDSSFGDSCEINGITYKAGMTLADNFQPFFEDEKIKDIILNEYYYHTCGSYCDECSTFHDTEQHYDLSFVIVNDCELLCKTCASAEDLIVEVEDSSDLFKAPDITGMGFANDDFVEVETLFCDSSGFGSQHEPALTVEQAEKRANALLQEHGTLYVGLTGIGQFQVYVTLYKQKVAKTA